MKLAAKMYKFSKLKSQFKIVDIKVIYAYLFKVVIPPFLVSFTLFTFFVETLDVLINLIRYLDKGIPMANILELQLLYLPTSISYALPVSILFSVTFSIGQLYSNNELIAIFVSGISLLRLVIPLVLLGLILSIGNYYFKERVVIRTFREKNELARIYLNQNLERSNSKVAILQEGGNVVYYAQFYENQSLTLRKPVIVKTDNDNRLIYRLNAENAQWNTEGYWDFFNAYMYRYNENTEEYEIQFYELFSDPSLNSAPQNFERIISDVDEMTYKEAMRYISQLKATGYSYNKLLADTYARIPLSLSPFIIMIIACLSGSVFRKNTLLLSLVNALVSSVIYYSADLVGSILAARNVLTPIVGSWLGFFTIIVFSISVYKFFVK